MMKTTFTTTLEWRMTKRACQSSDGVVVAGMSELLQLPVTLTDSAHGCSPQALAIVSSYQLTVHIVPVPVPEPRTMASTLCCNAEVVHMAVTDLLVGVRATGSTP